jgi:hypothetical protein
MSVDVLLVLSINASSGADLYVSEHWLVSVRNDRLSRLAQAVCVRYRTDCARLFY